MHRFEELKSSNTILEVLKYKFLETIIYCMVDLYTHALRERPWTMLWHSLALGEEMLMVVGDRAGRDRVRRP